DPQPHAIYPRSLHDALPIYDRRLRGERASPAKITCRSASSRRGGSDDASSSASPRKLEGVWQRTVTPSRSSRVRNTVGSRRVPSGTRTRRPPWRSAPHISQTETSNAKLWKRLQVSVESNLNHAAVASKIRTTLACDTSTPFGRPVEPEV